MRSQIARDGLPFAALGTSLADRAVYSSSLAETVGFPTGLHIFFEAFVRDARLPPTGQPETDSVNENSPK
jgi:hypothetical protein